MTTLELLKAYLNAFFVAREPERIFSLLTDDIHSYGIGSDTVITDIEQARALLGIPAYRRLADCALEIWDETEVGEDSATLGYTLTQRGLSLRYRLTGVSRVTPQGRRLYLLHSAAIEPRKSVSQFDELYDSQKAEKSHELLASAVPGGIMGGYMEPGFPFYYINDRMLRYLGY
ncbi:MAG: hypothetical protein PHY12_09765, partial [Eubacteriales bacterium]|nr:hypothetical protein [Eubacteriales bacterium]